MPITNVDMLRATRAQAPSPVRPTDDSNESRASMFKTIAVGTDGTETADTAVGIALDLADRYGRGF